MTTPADTATRSDRAGLCTAELGGGLRCDLPADDPKHGREQLGVSLHLTGGAHVWTTVGYAARQRGVVHDPDSPTPPLLSGDDPSNPSPSAGSQPTATPGTRDDLEAFVVDILNRDTYVPDWPADEQVIGRSYDFHSLQDRREHLQRYRARKIIQRVINHLRPTTGEPGDLNTAQLDSLEQAAAAATPGPWAPYFSMHGDPYVVPANHHAPTMYRLADVSTSPKDYGRANAEFMGAAGPDVVAALIAEVRRYRSADHTIPAGPTAPTAVNGPHTRTGDFGDDGDTA